MRGDMFGGKRKPDDNVVHISEILNQALKNHLSACLENSGAITKATLAFIDCAEDLKGSYSELACSRIKFELKEGDLREQQERLKPNDQAHDPIKALLKAAEEIYSSLTGENSTAPNPSDIKKDLCNYLIRPSLPEDTRFATKELLKAHVAQHGEDALIRDSILLAECLVILEKPLREDLGGMRLDDIRELTVNPAFWVAVLNNFYSGRDALRGTNREPVIECLKDNYPQVRDDAVVKGLLQVLAADSDPNVKDMYLQVLGLRPPTPPEPDLEWPKLDPFDL
jgi:hypothetical protein